MTSSETGRARDAGRPTPRRTMTTRGWRPTPEFVELRRRFRGFVFPMTVAFLAWYALYVVLSAYARDFMDTKVVGNLNVAFFFGLLQFVTTFLIAWLYSRFANGGSTRWRDELQTESSSWEARR